jgi:hypothetical protein
MDSQSGLFKSYLWQNRSVRQKNRQSELPPSFEPAAPANSSAA